MSWTVLHCLLIGLPALVKLVTVESHQSEQRRPIRATEEELNIYSLKIDSWITSRFAHTVITSRAVNRANVSKEVEFDVDLPKTAFITNFSMTIDGIVYMGTVKEKEAAQKVYQEAVSRGQSAGIVKASGRKMEKFKVSVSIAPSGKVTFQLTYEELLKRVFGKYEMLIRVKPKQLVDQFQIDVHISETQAITFLEAEASFLTDQLKENVQKSVAGKKGHVLFSPTVEEQRSCADCPTSLLDGDFLVKYEVDRTNSAGEIQIVNGYFVHFFAPENIPPMPKNIIFIIDRSSSMSGRKIQQTKDAFLKISEDLREDDYFNFVIFSSDITVWKESLVKATSQNVKDAKAYISKLTVNGATNINEALLMATKLLNDKLSNEQQMGRRFSLIIFLTDGDPTYGETNNERILANAKAAIGGHFTLYSLGFGKDVDYNFLEKLALENGGVARRIYDDSDAAVQLQGFFSEIANPLLLGVQMKYPGDNVNDITQNTFMHYYGGSEIVVAGRVTDNELTILPVEIKAEGATNNFTLNMEGKVREAWQHQQYIFGKYTERLWAYLTIQQLLEKHISAQAEEKYALKKKALDLSLKYSFVTPLTSMTVTKPDNEAKNATLVADKLTEAQRSGGAPTQTFSSQRSGGAPTQTFGLQRSGGAPTQTFNSRQTNTGTPQSFVDGDPHFIIQLPRHNESICFNIQEQPGVVLRLVADPETGIAVNAQVVGKNKDGSPGKAGNTYIGKLGFISQKMGIKVEVTTEICTVYTHQQKRSFHWNESVSMTQGGFKLSILNGSKMILSVGKEVTFEVVLHRRPKKHLDQQDFLGLYTLDSHQLSDQTHGLLGQFYHLTDAEVYYIPVSDEGEPRAVVVKNKSEVVVKGQWREDFREDPQKGVKTFCWFAEDNGNGLIDGSARDYIISGLFDMIESSKISDHPAI
ncbi:inter-alpha-trypsin inhibitor heavy chain H3-like isoform X1 [Pleurodeles waltl]|uniref:inter-alpha-trypsin inhibitor heavy chain H3-like isoform X1 n=1 Tax=Pleurodeles waltl TaxID=8319 RepID=UPI00370986F5